MLAIDRLKRIQNNAKRLSSVDRRGSGELLEPPSAYPTPKWLEGSTGGSPGPPGQDVIITTGRPRRSPSGDNLSGPTLAMGSTGELRTFQQHRGEELLPSSPLAAEIVHLRQNKHTVMYQPDVVAIQVNRSPAARNSNTSGDSAYESEGSGGSTGGGGQPTYQSFHSPIGVARDATRTREQEGDATPTNERREIPSSSGGTASDDSDGSSTLRRPSAKVSPRISPKPKPVAKIVAAKQAKRTSREMPTDIIKPLDKQDSPEPSNMLYSSNTLPRKSSRSASHSEHIYDQPASIMTQSEPSPTYSNFVFSRSSAPSSPAHTTGMYAQSLSPGAVKSKRAPPPPPKRTNSIKSEGPLLRSFSDRKSESSPPPASHRGAQQTFAQTLESKFAHGQGRPPGSPSHHSRASSLGAKESFPTSAPLASTASSSSAESQSSMASQQFSFGDADNPLNEVIQQLEEQGKTGGEEEGVGASGQPSKDVKLGDWQDEHVDSSGDDSDTGTLPRRNKSTASLESAGSGCSTDSNTLPFANENVGTIKQRNPANKPSIVTVSGGGDDKQMDLNCDLFEEETGTMKRNPKAAARAATAQPDHKGKWYLHTTGDVICRLFVRHGYVTSHMCYGSKNSVVQIFSILMKDILLKERQKEHRKPSPKKL